MVLELVIFFRPEDVSPESQGPLEAAFAAFSLAAILARSARIRGHSWRDNTGDVDNMAGRALCERTAAADLAACFALTLPKRKSDL